MSDGTESPKQLQLICSQDRGNLTMEDRKIPEQTAARNAKGSERRQSKELEVVTVTETESETPMLTKDTASVISADSEAKKRMARPKAKGLETPEQTAIRRAKAAASQKRRRARLKAERIALTSPAQIPGAEFLNESKTASFIIYEAQRLDRLRKIREARKLETPTKVAARRARAAECERRRRERLRAARETETPKETAVRLAKEAEKAKMITPEQAAARRARRAANEKKRRQLKALTATETPEKFAERRKRATELQRNKRTLLRVPRQAKKSALLINPSESQRRRREHLSVAEHTTEQSAARLVNEAELREAETHGRAETRSAEISEYSNSTKWSEDYLHRLETIRQTREARKKETLEQAVARRAGATECKQRRKSLLRAASEAKTPDQNPARFVARHEKAALGIRRRREQLRAAREADEPEFIFLKSSAISKRKERPHTRSQNVRAENLAKTTEFKQNDIDEALISSSIISVFEPEGSSIYDQPTVQHNLEETSIARSALKEDPWLGFYDPGLSFVSNDILHKKRVFESLVDVSQDHSFKLSESNDKQKTAATNLTWFFKLLDPNVGRDEHTVFCEYIAERFRKSNRSITEIEMAKSIIESIMLNLSTGVYRSSTSTISNEVNQEEEASTVRPAIIEPIVQTIIVKEEVHL